MYTWQDADSNCDRQLSFSEFRTGVLPVLREKQAVAAGRGAFERKQAEELFNLFDSNHDGTLSKDEIRTGLIENHGW